MVDSTVLSGDSSESPQSSLSKFAATRKAKVAALNSQGLCHCGKPFAVGKRMCQEHLDKRKNKVFELLAKGLCHCGAQLQEGRAQCAVHLKRNLTYTRKTQSKNREQGLCPCGKARAEGRKFCQPCLDAVLRRVTPRKRERKKRAIALLGGKCVDCGFTSEFLSVFDFHHLDPSIKDGSVSRLLASQKPWEEIVTEVLKCALLCAICHRIRHEKEHRGEQ